MPVRPSPHAPLRALHKVVSARRESPGEFASDPGGRAGDKGPTLTGVLTPGCSFAFRRQPLLLRAETAIPYAPSVGRADLRAPVDFMARIAACASSRRPDRCDRRCEGFVTPGPGCRIPEGAIAGCYEENQLCGLPVPARDHSSGDMALPPVHPQLARRRGFVGGTRSGGVLRDGSALGEPFRTDDRGQPAKASPEASYDVASGRGLSENRRPNGSTSGGPSTPRARSSMCWSSPSETSTPR